MRALALDTRSVWYGEQHTIDPLLDFDRPAFGGVHLSECKVQFGGSLVGSHRTDMTEMLTISSFGELTLMFCRAQRADSKLLFSFYSADHLRSISRRWGRSVDRWRGASQSTKRLSLGVPRPRVPHTID